jgi:trimeric autotransporter adhesin
MQRITPTYPDRPEQPNQSYGNYGVGDRSNQPPWLRRKEWQIVRQLVKLTLSLGVLGYSLPAVAGNCTVGQGTTDPKISEYISPEVYGSSVAARSLTDTLDDNWRNAVFPQTSPSWSGTNINTISNNESNLFTINGVDVGVALVNVDTSGNCSGTVNTGSPPQLTNFLTLQAGAPRPASLYNNTSPSSYWAEGGGLNTNRNGALFTFSRPVSAFGAWFGDLETRTNGGTPAILRLLDAAGNRIGKDIAIAPTNISNGGGFVSVDQSQCGGATNPNGCGNNTTRWIGFIDATARVKQALVIVGDDDSTAGSNNGNQESLSFIGANLIAAKITGTVFEDTNYGGGAGRSWNSSSSPRSGARVELYDASGAFKGFTTTDINGVYNFGDTNITGGIVPGQYTVRVVNRTVTSTRPGYVSTLLPVQTFRTQGLTINNIGVADPDRVGGEAPKLADAGDGSTTLAALTTVTTAAQSISTITVGTAGAAGVDFGFNFDTIINTNDSGQGSLRQFITNSNSLKGEVSLAQVGQPTGYETSIFMIPNGAAHPGQNTSYANQLTGGSAVINLLSGLPTITDTKTRLDGSTQTTNIKATPGGAETNPGQVGSGGTVGTGLISANSLAKFNRPEIEIKGKYTLTASGSYDEIKNVAFNSGDIVVSGVNSLVQDNLVGMSADGNVDTITAGVPNYGITAGSAINITIRHNYVRVNNSGIRRDSNGSNLIIEYNEVDVPSSGHNLTYDGILLIGSGTNDIIRYNLVKNMGGAGVELGFSGGTLTNTLIDNNTFKHNGYNGSNPSTETMGVVAYLAPNSQISLSNNIITENSGSGVVVLGATGVSLSKNSIFKNGSSGNGSGLSIDLDPNTRDPNGYGTANGVTPNTGTVSASLPNGGMNYPIFTKVQRVGNTLKLEGYIGNNPAGNSAFTGAEIEIYKADNDSNQDGKVVAGDNLNKPHGEGRYWIGNLTAGTNGLFNFSLPIPASLTDGLTTTTLGSADEITAIATNTATASIAPRSTSEFSVNTPITFGNPNLLLVKRITRINGSQLIGNQYDLSKYINDPNDFYDDNVLTSPMPVRVPALRPDTDKWPNTPNSTSSTFLIGGINGGTVKPKDEIEYTIYFLSTGDVATTNTLLCDRVPSNVTFASTAFNTYTPKATGGANESRGILALLNGNTESYTNVADGDVARYFPPGSNPQDVYPRVNCNGTNDNGAVVVNLGSLPPAMTAGDPIGSYGFVRFRGQVK